MENTLKDTLKDKKLKLCLIASLLFGLIVHGYAYFNMLYSNDSFIIDMHDDVIHQISIGRFVQPLLFMIKGYFYNPTFSGVLALFFIGLGAYFVIKFLEIEDEKRCLLITAIMVINISLILINASYIHDVDMYACSIFLSCLNAYLLKKLGKIKLLFCPILICIQLGIYQVFISITIFLFMIDAILSLLRNKDAREVFVCGLKVVLTILAGMLLYYVTYKLVIYIYEINASDAYNSINQVSNLLSLKQILNNLYETYSNVYEYFISYPVGLHYKFKALVNAIAILVGAYSLIKITIVRNLNKLNILLLFILLLLSPFALNITNFLSSSFHDLLSYPFIFLYILLILIVDENLENKSFNHHLFIGVSFILVCALLIDDSFYAAQIYLQQDINYQNTREIMNRVINRIEETEGFELGTSKIYIYGTLDDSPLMEDHDNFNYYGKGLNSTSLKFNDAYRDYFKNVLNYPNEIYLVGDEINDEEVLSAPKDMDVFPASDSVKVVNDYIVVKLADESRYE